MTTWMFVALLWFEGGTSWPDVIWSYVYQDRFTCEQAAKNSVVEWSKKPQVIGVMVSDCFRWTPYIGKEV